MAIRVLGLASGVTDLEDHRHAIAALVVSAGPVEARGGLFPAANPANLVSVSAMQAKVTSFYAWIDGSSAAMQAGYDFTSDSDVTLTFPDGEPAAARVDRVIARVRHNTYDASGSTVGSVEVLKGQPSGAATALPASCELLWEVTVPAGASAGNGGVNFTTARADKRRNTVAAGGVLPVADRTVRDAIANPYDGLAVYRRDRNWVEIYDGAAWRVQGVAIVSSVGDLTAITNPIAGQAAFNTADSQFYAYIAGSWRRTDWYAAWGVVGGTTYAVGGGSFGDLIGGAELALGINSGSVQTINGRRYALNVLVNVVRNTAGDVEMRIRDTNVAGAKRGYVHTPNLDAVENYVLPVTGRYEATSTAAKTFVLTGNILGSGTANFTRSGDVPVYFEVVDMGPTGLLANGG